jgi:hypothetical protein
VGNSLFIKLNCKNGTNLIGLYDVQTRRWNILDFSLTLFYDRIDWFEQGHLIVFKQLNQFKKYDFYKISFGLVVFGMSLIFAFQKSRIT